MIKPILQVPGLEVGEEIGRGGHSILYRATKDGKKYVVKMLKDDGPASELAEAHLDFRGRGRLSPVFTTPD